MSDNDRQPDQPGSDDTVSSSDQAPETHTARTDPTSSETTRTTTRERSRSRVRDRSNDASDDGEREDGDGGDDARAERASSSNSSEQDGDDQRSKRRRRRGRRGRGRGRGRSSGEQQAAQPEADDSSTGALEVDGKPDPAGQGDGSREDAGGKGRDGEVVRSRSRGGKSGRDAKADGGGKGDPERDEESEAESKGGRGRSTRSRSAGKGRGDSKAARAREADDADSTADDASDESEVEKAIARGGTRMAAKRSSRRGSGNGGGRRQPRPGGVPEEVRRAILEGPPRTMLVTAREDRTQIAVLEDRTVVEHYVTRKEDVTYVGNIYMARVQNVLPGMEAAFLDIGKGRNGVLYAGEVLYDELDLEEGADERIENVLKQGQKVLVQVTKDPMGTKGPRLTMHLSLAGRYMVLAPNSDLFGISRKLTDKERDRLRRIVKTVKPDHHGVIVRTAAEGASEEQITADIERLLGKWQKVEEAAKDAKALTPVYEEPPLVVKVIRDNFGPEFERCIVDDEDLYHQVRGYLDEVAPELLPKVELYGAPTADARARAAGAPSIEEANSDESTADAGGAQDDFPTEVDIAAANTRREKLPPLFDAYDVTDQLRKAMGKKVWLPSGGYLIIETTEAMKVIDVNTGKFTGGSDTNLEEVVLKTNLEAADEIVRQLRLRDMGGIIIIDFIDMLLKSNQDQVVRRLKRELLRDRTKTRVSEVSKLGLVQMTRKNVSQGLIESFSRTCDHCEGRGLISEID